VHEFYVSARPKKRIGALRRESQLREGIVRIQVNSDKNITVDDRVTHFIAFEVNRVLGRFTGKLTRVEVHLTDVNSHKFGMHDKRCLIEARPARYRTMAASDRARTVALAVRGALRKMQNSLQTFFGKLGQRRSKPRPTKAVIAKPRRRASKPKSNAEFTAGQMVTRSGRGHGPKKKGIYQARRNSWPRRAHGHA
jgi:hypothetical protein